VGQCPGVDAVAEAGEEVVLGGDAEGLQAGGGGDGAVGGEDVVVGAVEQQRGDFMAGGGVEIFLPHGGAGAADDGADGVAPARGGVEGGHRALRKAQKRDVGHGDGVVLAEALGEGFQLAAGGFDAVAVAEGPGGVGEPLQALVHPRGSGGVGGIDGQGFGEVTE